MSRVVVAWKPRSANASATTGSNCAAGSENADCDTDTTVVAQPILNAEKLVKVENLYDLANIDLLHGVEVNIRANGTLDVPDETLAAYAAGLILLAGGLGPDGAFRDRVVSPDGDTAREVRLVADLDVPAP